MRKGDAYSLPPEARAVAGRRDAARRQRPSSFLPRFTEPSEALGQPQAPIGQDCELPEYDIFHAADVGTVAATSDAVPDPRHGPRQGVSVLRAARP